MTKILGLLVLTSGIYTLVNSNDTFAAIGLIVVGIAVTLAAFNSSK